MNKLLTTAFLHLLLSGAIAQGPVENVETTKADSMSATELATLRQKIFDNNNIARFDIPINATTTIISPDPIVLVDISSAKAQGELSPSTDNRIFRIKPTTALLENDFVVITVVTKKYVSVMKLIARNTKALQAVYTIAINPNDTYRLDAFNSPGSGDFQKLALFALTRKRDIHDIKTKSDDLQAWVGNIFVAGEYILLDLSLKNKSDLPYDIESIRFRIIDKYTVSAHVSQEIEIVPDYTLYDKDNWQVTNKWRNLFIFPKFTYPDNKIFQIEVQEKQISGRKILINIDYDQILHSAMLQ